MITLKKGIIKRIHINKHKLASNLKHTETDPVITVKTSKDNVYGHRVVIKGESEVLYPIDKTLNCGARVWIETKAEVEVYNREENEEK